MSITLLPHQEEAVLRMLDTFILRNQRDFLLADDTGLGKTYTALAAAKEVQAIKPYPILVITTSSLKKHWQRSASELGIKDLEVLSYGQLSYGHLTDGRPEVQYRITIFDEAQYLRNKDSNMALVGSYLMATASHNILATATPTQNPYKAHYLATIFGIPDYDRWLVMASQFILRGCRYDRFRGHIWEPNIYDAETFRNLLHSTGAYIRRTSADINGWPELSLETDITEVDPDLDGKSYADLRLQLSYEKAPRTLELANEALDGGKQVIIYSCYLKPLKYLASQLHANVITGETPVAKRQELIDKFSAGTIDRLIISVVEGINLHQPTDAHPARLQINHDLPLSGISAKQLYGRCHRAGRAARNINMFTTHRIDRRLESLLMKTSEFMNGLFVPADCDDLHYLEAEFNNSHRV